MHTRKIKSLIIAEMSKSATERQRAELKEWLDEDPRNVALYETLHNAESITSGLNELLSYDSKEGLQRVEAKLKRTDKRRRWRLGVRVSAVASIVITIAAVLFYNPENGNERLSERTIVGVIQEDITQPMLISGNNITYLNDSLNDIQVENMTIKKDSSKISYHDIDQVAEPIYNTIIVPKMCKYMVELSDGTVVTLNANSEMTYSTVFKGDSRSVTLKGEAFFDVVTSDKPFIVYTDGAAVKVHGTKFNINCQMRNEIRATLLTGSVSVIPDNDSERMLIPGEMAVVNRSRGVINVEKVNVNKITAWLDNSFSWVDTDIRVLLSDIGSWYGVEFSYSSQLFENVKTTATFDKELQLNHILSSLSKVLNIEFIKTESNKYEVENKT